VVAQLRARARAAPDALRDHAVEALYRYLNPVVGGPDGTGWPFGRPVQSGEVFAVLQRLAGVELVEHKATKGPAVGLGVRVLGEVKPEYLEILARADHIFIEELQRDGLYDEVSQAFAVFLPVKSVGVTGDQRRYEYVIALRAVKTIDFMTARWARLPYEFLEKVSLRIANEISGVSRVVYDISGKPPATIEWE